MKFVCPSCKAKYQIADERVSGRSVKMKCRKCGELIYLSSSQPPPPGWSDAPPGEFASIAPPSGAELELEAKVAAARPKTGPEARADAGKPKPAHPAPVPGKPVGLAAAPPKPSSALAPAKPKSSPTAAPAKPASSPFASGGTGKADARGADVLGTPLPRAGRPGAPPKPSPERKSRPGVAPEPERKSRPGAPPDVERKSRPGPAPAPERKSRPGAPPAASSSRPVKPAAAGKAAPTRADSPQPPPTQDASANELAAAQDAGRVPIGFAVSSEPSKFFPEREESSFDPDDDARTVIAGRMGALAGAFSQAVRGSAVTALEELNRPLDDWYVGINGVPVGPMRLGELRSKAAATAITLDSLVWRDGLGEWAPLRTFPELVAIVEESQSSARASLAPVPPGSNVAARLPGGSLSGAPGPIAIRHAGDAPDPFAATQFAQMPFPTPAASTSSVDVPEEAAGVPKRGSSNFAMWFAVVVAIAFGLTIGLVFAPEAAPRTEVKFVQVPASNTATHGDIPAPPTSVAVAEDVASPNKRPSNVGVARPAAAGAASVATTEGEGVKGLKGLAGLRAPGPNGPSADAGGGGGGQPLDSTAVQRTVSRYTGSVKRSCWQPALETRDRDAPSTARVSVSISVGPSGSVQSVSASGDPKGYRGLSNCIQARVRGWQFPASSGTTNINVPFVFAAQ